MTDSSSSKKPKQPRRKKSSKSRPPRKEALEALMAAIRNAPATPPELPLLPLVHEVAFPGILMPLIINREKGIRLLESITSQERPIGLVTQRDPEVVDPGFDDLYPIVCVATVLKTLKFPDGTTRLVAHGLHRAELVEIKSTEPYLVAEVLSLQEQLPTGVETEALAHSVRRLFDRLIEVGAQIPEDLQVAALNTEEPGALCDLLASGLPFAIEEKQMLLAEPNVRTRLRRLNHLLRHQVQMQDLSSKIQGEASSELTRAQREQFLRQQMQAIRRELGEAEDEAGETSEFYQKLEALQLPEAATKEARREIDRMAQMHPSTPEYHVIRTFLDTLLSMPWRQSTTDRLDIRRARQILDQDHYNLKKVKERILEFLSVRKLKSDVRSPILCFVGPPGVGKTSLGKSIARTMGRKFVRVSLGGVHDEAEIRGHRRTYIGAMPGKVIQGLRRAESNNPVFMLDEVDKLSHDYRGDPASALLEVLDPEQNCAFRDHYLDIEFDLSKVMFICTANVTATIPGALLDRMEVIELSGYSEEEKLAIAKTYLVPKQTAEHGLSTEAIEFHDDGTRAVIQEYTHEAGVRNLDRELASICRKVARQHAEGRKTKAAIDAAKVHALLGAPKYLRSRRPPENIPGVATGLAWTPAGGDLLTIETIKTPGKNTLKLTGSLGEVMKESAHAALGYLRASADRLQIDQRFFEDFELHVHVPAGAIAKDGPSAGVALTASLLSLAVGKPLRPRLAMTGEITLTGSVLPVGGIREKVLAARRDRVETVILPNDNRKDAAELPREVLADVRLVYVKQMDEVIPYLFEEPAARRAAKPTEPDQAKRPAPAVPKPRSRPATPPP